MSEDNPAGAGPGEIAAGLSGAQATLRANGRRRSFAALASAGPPPPLAIDINKALAFVQACMSSKPRVGYGLGAKIKSDASQPGAPVPPGFLKVDCSGFVRA
ncbi:MAG TPA: hypothetical protein VGG29_10620, partial [Caulobacteraceae bacterium]